MRKGRSLALTKPLLLLSLAQLPDAVLAQLLQSQRFVALQPVRQGQEDGVHMLLLGRLLGRRLKQRVVVAVGEELGRRCGHLPQLPQIALVSHDDAGHQWPHRVAAALLDPLRDAFEGGEAGDVVHKDDGVDAAVVVLHHALAETLLTCCVPNLQLEEKHKQGFKKKLSWRSFFILVVKKYGNEKDGDLRKLSFYDCFHNSSFSQA